MSVQAVRPGQVWLDLDKRMFNRKLMVVRIEGQHAICAKEGNRSGKYHTRIRLDRFKKSSTGFVLVRDMPP